MTPKEAAQLLRDELEAALTDLAGESSTHRVAHVLPPEDLSADTCFRITLLSEAGSAELELSTRLAMGYLADEEAAVDEWRHWVHEVWDRLADSSD